MKVLKIVGIVLAVLIAAAVIFILVMRLRMYSGSRGGERIKMSPAVSFKFNYSGGSYLDSGNGYSAVLENGIVTVRIRKDGVSEEDADEFTTDASFMEKIDEIIAEYKVKKWNGFARSNRMVLDGHGFTLSIKMDNGEILSAHGYMAWPKNYSEFSGAIESLFMSLYGT